MKIEYVSFKNRAARSGYIRDRFSHLLAGKILDVGCDMAVLKKLLPDAEYTGVDIAGAPDIKLDLESIDKLPFNDGTFDCVICSDVLEHLDNLHHIFDELVRVAKNHIIISLPNNWVNARLPISRGKGSFGHYGLPAVPPPDRHKWFFGLSEAINFIKKKSETSAVTVAEMYINEKPRPVLLRSALKLMNASRERYLNRYAHTVWFVLKKK
ncbi:MAG: class I SAM-dependent methyltransferase [Elusimicrobiota bacterium]